MSPRQTWDEYFLNLAKQVATRSKDPSTKAGAVITDKRHRLISTGYNGFPHRMTDHPDWYADRDQKYSRIIHGEMNAAIHAPIGVSLIDTTLYTWPLMPCDRCFVHFLEYGTDRFVFPTSTPEIAERWGEAHDRVRSYASDAGVELVELNI